MSEPVAQAAAGVAESALDVSALRDFNGRVAVSIESQVGFVLMAMALSGMTEFSYQTSLEHPQLRKRIDGGAVRRLIDDRLATLLLADGTLV